MLLRVIGVSFFMLFSGFAASQEGISAEPENRQISWDLTDLYADEQAWQQAYDKTREQIEQLKQLKGTLGKNARSLAEGLSEISAVRKSLWRVYVYASLINDEDQRVSESQERLAKARVLVSEYSESVSWLEPELIAIGEKKLNRYLKREPSLAPFDFYLADLIRNIPHRLDEKGESMMAGRRQFAWLS